MRKPGDYVNYDISSSDTTNWGRRYNEAARGELSQEEINTAQQGPTALAIEGIYYAWSRCAFDSDGELVQVPFKECPREQGVMLFGDYSVVNAEFLVVKFEKTISVRLCDHQGYCFEVRRRAPEQGGE